MLKTFPYAHAVSLKRCPLDSRWTFCRGCRVSTEARIMNDIALGSIGFRIAATLLCFVLANSASAYLIDKRVTIQPIVMRSTDGSIAANPQVEIFEAETDKIWAQAGIDFEFLPVVYYDNNLYTNVSTDIFEPNSFYSLALDPGHRQSANPLVINLWFVRTIDGSATASGYSLQSKDNFGTLIERNGVSIADPAFAYGGGAGMRDIFAYEVGRNLGLDNGTPGASSDPNNLMKSSGPYPTSITNIYPDGAAYGHLTSEQVAMARRFSFAVSLPAAQQYSYPPPATNPPTLSITAVADEISLSWPYPSSGYVLQEADLATSEFFTNGWQNVAEPVTGTNGANRVILPIWPAARAFRLYKP